MQNHKVRFTRPAIGIVILILVLMILGAVTLIHAKNELRELQAQTETLKQEVTNTIEENAALDYKIEHSDDPEMMEQAAREELGLVKAGDKVFYDTNH